MMMYKDIEEKVPSLRFPEFDGEWEEKKLGEIAIFSKGKGVSKSEVDEYGATECIRYGELYTHYGEVITVILSKTNVPKIDLVLSEFNDVIIPASGETQLDIATASCVLKNNVALGGDLNIIKSPVEGVFLSYYLNNSRKKDIARLSQGVSVVHLYSNQLKSLLLNLPSKSEQQKIADFLTAVDKRIEQLEEKKRLLTEYKKGLMQQIFSQKIRFTDDHPPGEPLLPNGNSPSGNPYPDWQEKRLGDVAERRTKKNIDDAVVDVLTNSATQGIINQRDYFDKDIANQDNLKGYYLVHIDDFVYNPRISNAAPVGPIKRNQLKLGVMSPLYSVFRFTEGDETFFQLYFETTHWHRYMKGIANYGARHDRMNITTDGFMKMPLPFPCLEEQNKIADFLTSMDNKVEQVSAQLAHAKTFKKGLLQQMFV